MNFDMSFILGDNNAIDTPSNPTEPKQSNKGQTIPQQAQNAVQSPLAAFTDEQQKLLNAAREIVKRYKISREITEGAMLQLEKDLAEGKNNLPLNILCLVEALDRSSGGGDQYIKRAEQALKKSGYI